MVIVPLSGYSTPSSNPGIPVRELSTRVQRARPFLYLAHIHIVWRYGMDSLESFLKTQSFHWYSYTCVNLQI